MRVNVVNGEAANGKRSQQSYFRVIVLTDNN